MADIALSQPLVVGQKTLSQVTDDVCRPMERRPGMLWWSAFAASVSMLGLGVAAIGYQVATGIGTWGLNTTVGWAFDITNFVFWIGIGHAGTLISAILFLLRQRWRTGVNRAAEAMTLFAVMCAGIFPLIHMGRPWFGYWIFPYPNFRGPLWINFRSPLAWDAFAISTYFIISATFWYVGLLPDLAAIRDRAKPGLRRTIFSIASLGWDGSYKTWNRYEMVYLLLAGLATPLVVSVHTIVSWDFATSVIPGWHATIFPPYFVAGAIFSGMAMVLTLMIIARKAMGLQDYINARHLDVMSKLVIATGSIVGLAYLTEFFTAQYTGNRYEQFVFLNRALGPFAWAYWTMVSCNVIIPQLFWFREGPGVCGRDLHHHYLREHRDVVRALRHHRDVASSGLSAGELGELFAHADRNRYADREFRPVLHLVSPLLPHSPCNRDGGDQRCVETQGANRLEKAKGAHA